MHNLESGLTPDLLDDLEQVLEKLGGHRCPNGHLLAAVYETENFGVLVRRHGYDLTPAEVAALEDEHRKEREAMGSPGAGVAGPSQGPSEHDPAYWDDRMRKRQEYHEKYKVPIGRTADGHITYMSGHSDFLCGILQDVALPLESDAGQPPAAGDAS